MDSNNIQYFIIGLKLKYNEFYNNIPEQEICSFEKLINQDNINHHNGLFAIIDDLYGKYVYLGHVINKRVGDETVYINSTPLEKKEVQSIINKLFSPTVVGNVSFQVVDHYA